jgi:polyphosphate kinase 2 (PPK2 family)
VAAPRSPRPAERASGTVYRVEVSPKGVEVAKKTKRRDEGARGGPYGNRGRGAGETQARMKRKQYQRELRRLHGELVAMQARVKASAAKVCVVFEGRDTAGEGRHHQGDHPNASARGCSVPSPCPPPPNASSHRRTCTIHTAPSRQGEVVIFDRSWYNRGGVERVMGFCPPRPGHPIPATGPRCREGRGRLGHRAGEVLAGGQPGRADPPAPEPD